MRRVTEPRDPRLVNIVGAFAVALADGIRDATEAAAGMTGAAPAALVALDQFLAGRPEEDLAQTTGLTHSGAVRLVDRLVEAGLVERRPGRDARSRSIVLTARGRELSRQVTTARALAIEAVLERLGSDDSQGLLALTETLVASITAVRLGPRAQPDEPRAWMCRLCDLGSCGRPQGECPAANAAAQAHAGG
jgi:MarR family transcriptional regulator, negative regulator of the multidrug operon emrRAB